MSVQYVGALVMTTVEWSLEVVLHGVMLHVCVARFPLCANGKAAVLLSNQYEVQFAMYVCIVYNV